MPAPGPLGEAPLPAASGAPSTPDHVQRDGADGHRRELLELSDRVLDQIEELRLAGSHQVPDLLRHRLRQLLVAMGRADERAPLGLRGAHHLVFALQQRLMAANPRRPRAAGPAARSGGAPAVRPLRPGPRWKLIALPDEPEAGLDRQWLAAIDATLERAFDRWAYAQHHAVRAARRHQEAEAALVLARVAWNNYWDLVEQAHLIWQARGGPPSAP